MRRIWCLIRHRHPRKPYDAGDRSNDRADAYCGACGQHVAYNLPVGRYFTP